MGVSPGGDVGLLGSCPSQLQGALWTWMVVLRESSAGHEPGRAFLGPLCPVSLTSCHTGLSLCRRTQPRDTSQRPWSLPTCPPTSRATW